MAILIIRAREKGKKWKVDTAYDIESAIMAAEVMQENIAPTKEWARKRVTSTRRRVEWEHPDGHECRIVAAGITLN